MAEAAMDKLAVKMNIDPVELRLKNDNNKVRQKEYKLGAERFGWKEKYKKPGSSPGPIKTGVGCASATWGGGGRGTRAEVQIASDGSVKYAAARRTGHRFENGDRARGC
jgi:xanthine dehydrogenase YagR molybdenum-binding subunit